MYIVHAAIQCCSARVHKVLATLNVRMNAKYRRMVPRLPEMYLYLKSTVRGRNYIRDLKRGGCPLFATHCMTHNAHI